jgi:hypothetical protein
MSSTTFSWRDDVTGGRAHLDVGIVELRVQVMTADVRDDQARRLRDRDRRRM